MGLESRRCKKRMKENRLTTWFCNDSSAEHYEIEDDGEVFFVDRHGARTLLEDPETRKILLNGAERAEKLATEADKEPLSIEVAGRDLTVGDLSHRLKVPLRGE